MRRGLLVLGLAAACAGCSPREAPLPERIVVFGVDAADPAVVAALRARGDLPNFDRLLEEGFSADLVVDEPFFSPRIWTSIFTGFRPEAHGIESFTLPAGPEGRRIPVTSNLIRRRPVWDILGEAGITVGVVGHWVTWPARPVNGFLLSNYTWPPTEDFEKEWSPAADWDTVGMRTYPEGVDAEAAGAVREERYFRAADFPNADRLDPALRHYLEKDLAYLNAAFALFDERRPRFFTFYLEATDFFPHKLWMFHRYYETERFGGSMEGLPVPENPPPRAVVDTYGPMVAETYRLADRVLGEILERVDLLKDAVLVVSDHGFRTYPPGTVLHVGDDRFVEMPFWHGDTGILLAGGAPFRRGKLEAPVRPEDVTALLLAAFGLPVGAEMDGTIPEGAFREGFLRDHPIRFVESWEREPAGDETPIESPFDERMLEKLRSLGYIH
ncbi:MAG: alkaline phosphatase family protein [Candidatus Eisenbacteria bacterium]